MADRPFDAVAFDLFGTLVDEWTVDEWRSCLASMASALRIDTEPFTREWRTTADARLTGGFRTLEENLAAICETLGVEPPMGCVETAVRRRMRVMHGLIRPRADAEPTLRDLRARGLRTALVSMCSPEVPVLWRALPVAGLLDAEVFSCEDGVRKPDPAIYALAAERLGVPAGRVLYVGDGSFGELTGAAAAGMTAVMIRAAHEAELVIERAEEDAAWTGPRVASLAEVLGHI